MKEEVKSKTIKIDETSIKVVSVIPQPSIVNEDVYSLESLDRYEADLVSDEDNLNAYIKEETERIATQRERFALIRKQIEELPFDAKKVDEVQSTDEVVAELSENKVK